MNARARWTTYLLYACMALDLIAIASGLSQRRLLSRVAAGESLSSEEADASRPRKRRLRDPHGRRLTPPRPPPKHYLLPHG